MSKEKSKQLTEKDARAILGGLEVLSGIANSDEDSEAYGIVMAHIREGLRKGLFPSPRGIFGFFSRASSLDKIAQEEAMVLQAETVIDGKGWRAFLPSSRGLNHFEEESPKYQFLYNPGGYFRAYGLNSEMRIRIITDSRGEKRFQLDTFGGEHYSPTHLGSVFLPHSQNNNTLESFVGFEGTTYTNKKVIPNTFIFRLRAPTNLNLNPFTGGDYRIEASRMRIIQQENID